MDPASSFVTYCHGSEGTCALAVKYLCIVCMCTHSPGGCITFCYKESKYLPNCTFRYSFCAWRLLCTGLLFRNMRWRSRSRASQIAGKKSRTVLICIFWHFLVFLLLLLVWLFLKFIQHQKRWQVPGHYLCWQIEEKHCQVHPGCLYVGYSVGLQGFILLSWLAEHMEHLWICFNLRLFVVIPPKGDLMFSLKHIHKIQPRRDSK